MYSQSNYLAWEYPGIGRSVFFLSMHGFVYFSFLFLIESDVLNRIKSAFFSNVVYRDSAKPYQQLNSIISNAQLNNHSIQKASNTEIGEDGDVREECNEVMKIPISELESNGIVLFIKELTKVYSGNFRAVNNICLKVC